MKVKLVINDNSAAVGRMMEDTAEQRLRRELMRRRMNHNHTIRVCRVLGWIKSDVNILRRFRESF